MPPRYVESVHAGYEPGKLERIVSSSRCHKGRLLHYFPREEPQSERSCTSMPLARPGGCLEEGGAVCSSEATRDTGEGGASVAAGQDDGDVAGDSFSDWCGWHHDHSSLTGEALEHSALDTLCLEASGVRPRWGGGNRLRQSYWQFARKESSSRSCPFVSAMLWVRWKDTLRHTLVLAG